jgi:hypothetical protein
MSNRIRQLEVRDHSLIPAAAELRITVVPEQMTPTTEVRGRLMGPRCPYAATVEVAYPLRPLARSADGLAARVVIPEASLWEPESPFLYEGPVELWQDGRCCDRVVVRRGLRRLTLGAKGLGVNGRPLFLRGRALEQCDEPQALALRREGCNLLVAPVNKTTVPLWDLGDRYGFFLLGRLADSDEAAWKRLDALATHASCFGWLMGPEGARLRPSPGGARVGVELEDLPTGGIPEGVHFLACPGEKAPYLAVFGLPLFALGGAGDAPGLFGRLE